MAEQTIFKRLKQDHDKHREMLTRMTVAQDPDDRKALFENFKVEVKAHAAAEEETLYSTMLEDPELRHDGQHSVAEHKELDDLIMKMDDLDPSSREWTEKLKKLSHDYLHHIEEEEKDMFPAAAEELSKKEEVALKDKFEERKPEEYQRALEGADEGDDRD